jgi:hypothetical protein
MAQKFTLSARSALMANISAADTSLLVDITKADLFPVANTGSDPVPTVGKDWFKIILEDTSYNKEIVYVRTRVSGDAAMTQLLRGQEGTTARAFLAGGTIVGLRHTPEDLGDAISFASGASAFWKALVGWTTAALSRAALGASVVGDAIFTAANVGAARSALGATAIGDALFTATDQATAFAILTSDFKGSMRVATTANIASLAGGAPSVLDGITLAANDRVLVKDQTNPVLNGLYYVATLGTGANGTWTRVTDADGAGELTSGAVFSVEEGAANADSLWMLTTDGTITIGTTALTFARKDSSLPVPARQSILAGAATFIQIGTGLACNLLATAVPMRFSFAAGIGASGAIDYVGSAAADVASFWSGLTASSTNYLFVDRNASTGALTGVASLLPYIAQDSSVAPSTVNGQHTYVYDTGQMYVGNGSVATAVQRTAVGECVAGVSTITSVTSYAKLREYESGLVATLPGASAAVSVNHNVGTKVGLVVVAWLECITTDNGYAVGDRLTAWTTANGTYDDTQPIWWNAKSCGFGTNASVAFRSVPKGGGNGSNGLTAANWKYGFTVGSVWK